MTNVLQLMVEADKRERREMYAARTKKMTYMGVPLVAAIFATGAVIDKIVDRRIEGLVEEASNSSSHLRCGIDDQGQVSVVANGPYAQLVYEASFQPLDEPNNEGSLGVCFVRYADPNNPTAVREGVTIAVPERWALETI